MSDNNNTNENSDKDTTCIKVQSRSSDSLHLRSDRNRSDKHEEEGCEVNDTQDDLPCVGGESYRKDSTDDARSVRDEKFDIGNHHDERAGADSDNGIEGVGDRPSVMSSRKGISTG